MRRHIITLLTALAIIAAATPLAFADQQDSVNEAIDNSITASENFDAFQQARVNDNSDRYYTDLAREATTTAAELRRAAANFTIDGLRAGNEKTAISNMRKATIKEAGALDMLATAATANNFKQSSAAYMQRENAIADYNAAYDSYAKALYVLTDAQYQLLYWGLFVVTLAVSVITGLWWLVRGYGCTHKKTAPQLKQQQRRTKLLLASLAPFTGAVITLGSYYFTVGGVYLVAWGAIVIGAGYYVREFVQYNRSTRKASS